MTIIDGVHFGDQAYTLKEVQDILNHKKKKFSITITNSLKSRR